MHNSKLLATLRKMDTYSLKGLDQYIRANAISGSAQLLPFWEIIYQTKSEFEGSQLAKKAIHEQLFSGQRFNDKRIRELISSVFSAYPALPVSSRIG